MNEMLLARILDGINDLVYIELKHYSKNKNIDHPDSVFEAMVNATAEKKESDYMVFEDADAFDEFMRNKRKED